MQEKRFKQFSNSTEFIPYLVLGISLAFGSTEQDRSGGDFEPAQTEIRDPKFFFKTTETNPISKQKYSLDRLILNKKIVGSLALLEDNWNGYGGQRIPEAVIEKVNHLLPNLEFQPQIFPTGRGTIQLDFHISDDKFIEVEVAPTEIFAYFKFDDKEEEVEINESTLFDLVRKFNA